MLSDRFRNEVKRKYKPLTVKAGFMNGVYPDGTSVVSVAMFNEYGDTNRPPRPFMRNTVADKSGISKDMTKIMSKELSMETRMSQIGELFVSRIKQSIVDGEYAPLAPVSVKTKGFEKPLIDTSFMLKSVTWVME